MDFKEELLHKTRNETLSRIVYFCGSLHSVTGSNSYFLFVHYQNSVSFPFPLYYWSVGLDMVTSLTRTLGTSRDP